MAVSPYKQSFHERGTIPHRLRAGVAQPKARKWLIGIAALALVFGGYWHFTNGNVPTGSGHQVAAPVRTAKVERRDMAVVERTLGTVVANATVQVTARVQGTLESANFQEGQFVKKGDLLFQIDPRAFQAELAQAQAGLLRDEALLLNANRDKQRYQNLYRQNAISSQQRDTSVTNADVLAATVAADKAAVDIARINLGYTQIRSPVDGKTGPLLVQPGNMVAANGSTTLITIAQIQPVKLSFNLPQSDLPLIQRRQKVHPLVATIDVRGLQAHPLSAPVDFTSNIVNNQSGTVELRANFDNADLSLLPGQLVNVTVDLNDIPNALVVPHDAINDGPNGSYVYLVIGNRAVQRAVKILFDDSKNVAVEGDLEPGNDVIIEGQLRVVPDGTVNVLPPTGARQNTKAGKGVKPTNAAGHKAGKPL